MRAVEGPGPAAGPTSAEAEPPRVELFEHAVLRVAAWPVETLDLFASEGLATAAADALTAIQGAEVRAAELILRIHDAVPEVTDRAARAHLLMLKRRLHRDAAVLPSAVVAVAAELATVVPDLWVALEQERDERDRLAARRRNLADGYHRELTRQREALRNICGERRFRRALELANPRLAIRWAGALDRPSSDKARARRLEASVLHTLMRAVGRPTPQDAWAGVAPVMPAGDDGPGNDATLLSIDRAPATFRVVVDLEPFAEVVAALRRQPRYRILPLRLNPTARPVGSGWRYERGTVAGLHWVPVPDTANCRKLITAFRDGGLRSAATVIEELGGDDASIRAALAAEVARLVDAGVLLVDLEMPAAAGDVWATLDAVAPQLLAGDRSRWVDAVARIRRVCEDLGSRFEQLDPEDIRAACLAIATEVESLCRWAGLTDVPPPALHLDARAPFRVSWNRLQRRRAVQAVRELLAFHMKDGMAEAYRRASLASLAGVATTVGDDALAAFVDGTGFAREAPSGPDLDTLDGIFARFAGEDDSAVSEHRRAWERRLEPIHDRRQVDLTASDLDPRPVAGPQGAIVLSLGGGGAFAADWGRPQAGMFVARHAGVLADDDGNESPLVTELRRCNDAAQALGVLSADVVGADPLNLSVAVRPVLTPRRIEPHGARACSFDGLRLELDPDAMRPWVLGPTGERIMPVYHSAAAIGAVDPCSWLVFRVAMGHGWEFLSFGFPALERERSAWHHLPRLVLPGGTVLSAERWTIPGETLETMAGLDGPDRYLAWRAEVGRIGLPPVVRVRWDPHPGASPLLLRTDSPLAVESLFLMLPAGCPRLIVTEVSSPIEDHCVRGPDGHHHLVELAVAWRDDTYWGAVLPEAVGVGDVA